MQVHGVPFSNVLHCEDATLKEIVSYAKKIDFIDTRPAYWSSATFTELGVKVCT